MTDQGLKHISSLKSIEKLDIFGLKISGRGLFGMKSLTSFSCSRSKIFDWALCDILQSCKNLQWLDIKNCPHVGSLTIQTAMKVVSSRENHIVLRIKTDFRLVSIARDKIPQYLEFTCYNSYYDDRYNERYCRIWRELDKTEHVMLETIEHMDSRYTYRTDVPFLNFDCLEHVFKFIPLLDRMKMRLGWFER